MRAARETPYPEVITILVKAGSDINAVTAPEPQDASSPDKKTALHFAIENPDSAVLAALLAHKPQVNPFRDATRACSPLSLAAGTKDREQHFFLLLKAGARPTQNEIRHAGIWSFLGLDNVRKDEQEIEAPRVARKTAAAMTGGLLEIIPAPECWVLQNALKSGQSDAALLLIKAGADPACKGPGTITNLYHALHRREREHAIPDPSPELIRELLKSNDVNVGYVSRNSENAPLGSAFDPAPFALACRASLDVAVVKLLKENGAAIAPAINDPLVAVLKAGRDNPDLVAYLLELGFSPSRPDGRGLTPMQAAARKPYKTKSAPLLVRAGAKPPLWEEGRAANNDFLVQSGLCDASGQPLIEPGDNPADAAFNAAQARKIVNEARADPERALYSETFYGVATPEEVRTVIGGRSLKGVRTRTGAYTIQPGHGPGALIGNMFLALPGNDTRTYRKQDTPFTHAARVTPYPGVIDVLVAAGCEVRALKSEALNLAVRNPNPAVLERVLKYTPDLAASTHDGDTPLHYLAWGSDATEEHWRVMMAAKPDLNAGNGRGETPLMRAIWWKRADRARSLMRAGADVNAGAQYGQTALRYAVDTGQYDLARELLAAGARDIPDQRNESALSEIVSRKDCDFDLLHLLLEQTDVTSEQAARALRAAVFNANVEAYVLLRDKGVPFYKEMLSNILGELIYSNRRKPADAVMAARLLADGVDPNGTVHMYGSYLLYAVHTLQPDICAALVKGGANVHERGEIGFTPLLAAVHSSYLDNEDTGQRRAGVVRALLAGGADVNAENNEGWSVMLLGMNKPTVLPLLLEAGAPVDKQAGCGWTPLSYAAWDKSYTGAIPGLLAAGADPRKKDRSGKTPTDRAREKKNGLAMALLEEAGK